MKETKKILIVGADLSSNGGIASVIRAYNSALEKGDYTINLVFLKTNYYKDKGKGHEFLVLLKSIFSYIYLLLFGEIRLIHVHSSAHISFYRKSLFIFIAKVLNKKVIIHLHSSNFYDFFIKGSWYVSKVLSLCDRVIVLCTDWEKKLKAEYPGLHICKIENPFTGIVHNQKEDTSYELGIRILYMGFLIENKGIRDLMAIAERLKSEYSNSVYIYIAGKGELEGFIINTIKEKNLQDSVFFLGWIDNELKEEAFREADIFILPSYKEGMPISILEAMSFGLPILSTNISGIPDLIEDGINGYLDTPGDINGMYEHIKQLIHDPEKRKSMGAKNIERIKLNTEDLIFKQVADLYYELI